LMENVQGWSVRIVWTARWAAAVVDERCVKAVDGA
jgi:hypothetical protein